MKNPKITFMIRHVAHQMRYARGLAEGMKRHGYTNVAIYESMLPDALDSDLLVFWNAKSTSIMNNQRSRGKRSLIMERAYIGDRFNWMSLGYDGLNGRADFCNAGKDSTRWNKHFSQYIQPWNYDSVIDGRYALVIGQVLGDAAVKHIDIQEWYHKVIKELNNQGHQVLFRNHPSSKIKWNGDTSLNYHVDTNEHLEDSLKYAKFTVTFSSNAGVISALHGVPVVAYDIGSMVYKIATHDVKQEIIIPNRTSWASEIAWCQWLPEELENGDAWDHLAPFLYK